MGLPEKPIAKLRNWLFIDNFGVAYLIGNVYGHWRFKDGINVRTSYIKNAKKEHDRFVIETCNTIYVCLFEDMSAEQMPLAVDALWESLQVYTN